MTKFSFKVDKSKDWARRGRLTTARGIVKTPVFMPVGTLGTVKGLSAGELSNLGYGLMLANTYHLYLNPGGSVVEDLGGLHRFMNWPGAILTDSGGFQVFSLARARQISEEGVTFFEPKSGDKILLTPELSIQTQFELGADIIMAFDDVIGLKDARPAEVKASMERTNRWLARCVAEYRRQSKRLAPGRPAPALFGIVQGGLSPELRRQSLDFIQSQPVAGVAIGGLSVGETRREMYSMLDFLAPLLDPARPRYLMGVGAPADLRYGISRGIDMFDCVLPTRNGRHAHAWIRGDVVLNLKSRLHNGDSSPIDPDCDCPACTSGYSRAFIRHLFTVGESLAGRLLTIHNLAYIKRVVDEAASAID